MNKMKNFAKAAVLSAAIASALAGCTTVGNWERTSSNWEPTGIERKIEKEKSTETTSKKVFNISDLIEDNGYSININSSLWQTNYQIKDISKIPQLRELENENRTIITRKINGPEVMLPLLSSLLGGWAGAYAANGFKSLYDEKSPPGDGATVGGVIGAIGGFALGVYLDHEFISPRETKIETRQTPTERTKEGSPIYNGTEKSFLDEGWSSQNDPARNINVILSLDKFNRRTKTNSDGELSLSGFLQSAGSNYFFADEIPSRSDLEKIARNSLLAQQIRKPTLDRLLNELVKGVFSEQNRLTVATDETPKAGEKVENVSKTFMVKSYALSNDAVYRIVQSFVDKEINSYIKNLTLDIKDRTTRVPISGANFSINSDAPSPVELAGKYFTDNLMEYARRQIKDYLYGESLQENLPARIILPVYAPSNISYEVTQPDYKYITDSFPVNGDRKGIIYMIDKGDKIRVESETDKSGVTEWTK